MGMIFGKETVAEPSYKVLLNAAVKGNRVPYEIREYGTRYAAQTIYPVGTSTGVPFRALAEYIGVFGTPANIGQTSIDMTAPVSMTTKAMGPVPIAMTAPVSMKTGTTSTATSDQNRIMTFYLPAIYNENPDSIPKPSNPNVQITKVSSAIGAVHRFSGTMDTDVAQDRAQQLRQQLIDDGMEFKNSETDTSKTDYYEAWGYNPPFTIPQFRRNEIWIEITQKQLQQLIDHKQKQEQNVSV